MQASLEKRFLTTAAQYQRDSSLDAFDQLGLWWPTSNDRVVVQDDKGSSLIPQHKSYKTDVRINLVPDRDQLVD